MNMVFLSLINLILDTTSDNYQQYKCYTDLMILSNIIADWNLLYKGFIKAQLSNIFCPILENFIKDIGGTFLAMSISVKTPNPALGSVVGVDAV